MGLTNLTSAESLTRLFSLVVLLVVERCIPLLLQKSVFQNAVGYLLRWKMAFRQPRTSELLKKEWEMERVNRFPPIITDTAMDPHLVSQP